MKKIISLILALVMVMALAVGASAESTSGTITITPPAGIDATDTNTYTYDIYKVFDASGNGTSISYKLVSGKTTAPAGFTVDTAGNVSYTGSSTTDQLTADDIAAIAAYVTESDKVATVEATGSSNAVASNLSNGYYYITTATGSAVTITSTNPDAEVNNKNTVPTLTKSADKTTAAFGEEVTYTVNVNIPATANAEIVVHDTMTGLTYVDSSASAKSAETTVNVAAAKSSSCDCTMEFTLSKDDVKTYAGKTVVITYKATVDADENVATNEAYLTCAGFTSTKDTTEVKNYQIDVYKYTGSDDVKTGLAGAGFVLKNENGKYYKLTDDGIVSWVDSADAITPDLTGENNNFTVTFKGLANGIYTLIEKTVPAGYNRANDETITIDNADKTGDAKIEVLNQTGSELPSTGGMGTTLFYVIGGLLMASAAVLLITKKKMS